MNLPHDWPTGLVPWGWIAGVPFSYGQPYVVLPTGQTVAINWQAKQNRS